MNRDLEHDKTLIDDAVAARTRGDFRTAIGIYTDLLQRHQKSEFYHERGTMYAKCGEFNHAITDLTTAIELNPVDADCYVNRGNAYLRKGEVGRAIDDYSKAIAIAPDLKQAFNSRASAYSRLKRIDDATADFESAIRLDKSYVPAIFNLGRMQFENQNLDESLKLLTKANRLKPNDAMILYIRGDVLRTLGRFDESLRDYLQAVYIDPQSAEALHRLAWILVTCPDDSVRDGEKALTYARQGCELTSWKSSPAIQAFSAACAECGKFDEAIQWQTKAISLSQPSEQNNARRLLDLYRQNMTYRDK